MYTTLSKQRYNALTETGNIKLTQMRIILNKENKMTTFTKAYEVTPNEAQLEAITRALKSTVTYFLNTEKKDVTLSIKAFDGDKLIASVMVNNIAIESRIVGVKGGLTVV